MTAAKHGPKSLPPWEGEDELAAEKARVYSARPVGPSAHRGLAKKPDRPTVGPEKGESWRGTSVRDMSELQAKEALNELLRQRKRLLAKIRSLLSMLEQGE